MRPRPIDHLESASRDYPGAWAQYDSFLAQRSVLGGWPDWCFCPLAGAYAIVSGGGDNRVPLGKSLDISRLGALAAWRPTQGIYRFDPDLLAALWDTPLAGDLPIEHLLRLPEWCVYVELSLETHGAHGFFAHLEWDAEEERPELRLLIDYPRELAPIALHLGGTIEASVAGFVAHANAQAAKASFPVGIPGSAISQIATLATPLVSVLLYLCAEDAEIRPTRGRPKEGRLATRNGRMPAARHLEVWETGYGLGAELRAARDAQGSGEGTVRPHVRRAHWHSYWRGERRSERVLRWLSPILVGGGPERPTRRSVK